MSRSSATAGTGHLSNIDNAFHKFRLVIALCPSHREVSLQRMKANPSRCPCFETSQLRRWPLMPVAFRLCSCILGAVMKAFLHLFRQLSEVHLGDSRLATQHDAVGFDTPHFNVFVFLPVNRFEVIGESD